MFTEAGGGVVDRVSAVSSVEIGEFAGGVVDRVSAVSSVAIGEFADGVAGGVSSIAIGGFEVLVDWL